MSKALWSMLDGLDALSRWAIVACMGGMIAVVSAQVVLRYGFSGSLDWAEEISRLAFVWAVFMAIPHGVKAAAHVGIDVLAKRLPVGFNDLLQRLINFASAGLLTLVACQAALEARYNWDQMMPTVELSGGWFYLAVAVGCAHSALHLVRQALANRAIAQPALAEAVQ